VGLGFRVPMIVVSPFTRGGMVCGDTFDHTSILRLLEQRFGVREPNISAWRRSVVGDLTETLGCLARPNFTIPTLPNAKALSQAAATEVSSLPAPTIPKVQAMPQQEPGTRPRVGTGCAVAPSHKGTPPRAKRRKHHKHKHHKRRRSTDPR
jgi:phospholipase C